MSSIINMCNGIYAGSGNIAGNTYRNAITRQEQYPNFPLDIASVTPPSGSFMHFDGIGKMLFSIFM